MEKQACTQDSVRAVLTDGAKRVADAKKAVDKAMAALTVPEALDDLMKLLEVLRVDLTGDQPCGDVEPNDLMPEAYQLRRAIEKDLMGSLTALHERIHRALASAKVTGDSARAVHRKLLESADSELTTAEKTALVPISSSGPIASVAAPAADAVGNGGATS